MENLEVEFRIEGELLKGKILDKVLVLVVGASANYHNYVILEERTKKIHIVNPLNLVRI